MHATVHLADLGVAALRRWHRSVPRVGHTPGLRFAVAPVPAPLGTRGPRPQFGRLALVAFWDDEGAALDHVAGTILESGWHAHLRPVRAVGGWPGLPAELPSAPEPVQEGPAVVLTIGRLRLSQAHRFFPASARAEAQVVASPGLTFATGMAHPLRRLLATFSWWHDPAEMVRVALGAGAHRAAAEEQVRKDFHHASAFIRFRPLRVAGSLAGRNPLPDLASALR